MRRTIVISILSVIAGVAALAATTSASTPRHDAIGPTSHPQIHWASPKLHRPQMSDAAAAALVTPEPEVRPGNIPYNLYVPTKRQLRAFYTAKDHAHHTPIWNNPLNRYVTGQSHLTNPTTDMLIQWAAHKWGIPEDTLRAVAQQETWWAQDEPGDIEKIPASWWPKYPSQAHITGTHKRVYESMGIMQIRWRPNGTAGVGTEPLRWQSTAFNIDYASAMLRYYFDGYCNKCGRGYKRGQAWASIGAYNQPTPWGNSKAKAYIGRIKLRLSVKLWLSPWF